MEFFRKMKSLSSYNYFSGPKCYSIADQNIVEALMLYVVPIKTFKIDLYAEIPHYYQCALFFE